MTAPEENWGLTQEQLTEIRFHAKFNNRIRRFTNNSTIKTFQDIFGSSEGERLREHWINIKRNFERFMSYLTTSQRNDLLAYIMKTYSEL